MTAWSMKESGQLALEGSWEWQCTGITACILRPSSTGLPKGLPVPLTGKKGENIYNRDKRPHKQQAPQYYVWNDQKEETLVSHKDGYGQGFALLIVLFVLLVIIGCACWY
ncbi:hypothetical protein CR205_09820 [Alteribacter lacisalsi]|uniref:Uncharacterized protein n=1 Tax=Alteribacter lacisalsi TaxID=2045244 RepID=A0A2W0HMP3_9BACI|nr:hypothetical protein CR205_09820 [Alteribacter lacisalsi]